MRAMLISKSHEHPVMMAAVAGGKRRVTEQEWGGWIETEGNCELVGEEQTDRTGQRLGEGTDLERG